MRHSLSKGTLVVLRSVIGLTQEDLAKLLGCSRMTIQAIESAKLRLSEKMAAKITLFTGVSMRWLLANNYKLTPMCERDPEKPYTRETFQMTRAEVFDPRIHPLDVRAIQNLLAVAYHRVCDAAIQAYRAKEVTYFNYALREFMETVEQRWPNSRELPISMDVAETASNSAVLLEKARSEKLPPN